MADLSKLKRRSTLGAPPPPAEASTNLDAPEVAPPPAPPAVSEASPSARPPASSSAGEGRRSRDGRSARRTGRTIQFATRVTPEFDERFRTIAERDGLLHVELLEKSLAAYEDRGRR